MNKINKVYFDMDGVLADFEDRLFRRTGVTRDELYAMGKEKAELLVYKIVKHDPDWFYDLLPTRYFQQMVDFMDFLNGEGVEVNILTSMGSDFYADFDVTTHQAKADWLDVNGVTDYITNMCIVPKCYMKQYYAEPDAILVDDKQSNCDEFTAKGGIAIKVDLDATADDIETIFDDAKRIFFGV